MKKPFDFIILSMCRWDDVYSSTIYSLARELSTNYRVFYIDHPFTLKDVALNFGAARIKMRKDALLKGKNPYRKIDGLPHNFTAVTPPYTWPVNFLPEGRLYNWLSEINEATVWNTIRQTIADFSISDFVFINSFDPFYCRKFPSDIQPLLTIYQSTDDITQEKYIARHGVRLEREALDNAQLCLATSRELCKKLSTQITQVQYLPNAANFSLFNRAATQSFEMPEELKAVNPNRNRKIIGYVGDLSHLRIDFELLLKTAQIHPDKLLVFVGKKQCSEIELPALPNMVFIEPKPLEQLPAYLHFFDCCIIPFECNTLTRSIYPLKINEYLAAGKPVVSTAFSDEIRQFMSVANITHSHRQFVQSIQEAIDTDSALLQQHRIETARNNSWPVRTQQLLQLICRYLPQNLQTQTTTSYEPLETIH
ncbi:hypothetical protein C7N43_09070 [Sphingobacteriales bacterium UPWRP_1]|nr:hypothetical protein B6N25_08735 [Sphingobacteriales bacterium TSM_CSS]PSJ77375.1 hypothetical protein C7N43_09070 [Sphingobacteriales bacterium UPWRP_1]